jgi:hypothetical protein
MRANFNGQNETIIRRITGDHVVEVIILVPSFVGNCMVWLSQNPCRRT